MSGYPIESPSERAAGVVVKAIKDASNTRQKIELPTGAKWVSLAYKTVPGSTSAVGQYLKVVFNAASDENADSLLTFDDASIPIFLNDVDIQIPFEKSAPCYRIDVITSVAIGTDKTILRMIAGV